MLKYKVLRVPTNETIPEFRSRLDARFWLPVTSMTGQLPHRLQSKTDPENGGEAAKEVFPRRNLRVGITDVVSGWLVCSDRLLSVHHPSILPKHETSRK